MEIKIGGKTRFENLLKQLFHSPLLDMKCMIITNSRYALVGYFITSYPTRAHGIIVNRPFSYSRYRTGTSLQVRLMRGVFSNANYIQLFFNDIPPHKPPLHVSSSPIPGIRKWPIINKIIDSGSIIVIVIARIGHSPWGFSGPILQCFLRLLGEIGRQLI